MLGHVKAVIVTGGLFPPVDRVDAYLREADLLIAADSGLKICLDYGFEPDVVAGDFDSLDSPELLDGFSDVRKYPQDKDLTDTELALDIAFSEGSADVTLIGGGGGRIDHLIGIYEIFHRELHPSRWISDAAQFDAIDTKLDVRGSVGQIVSLFPVGPIPCRMRTSGLKWSLDDIRWSRGDIGVSNEFAAPVVSVTMIEGRLVMIRALEVH